MNIETILTLGGMLLLLIVVHEFGHFIVAKRSGARVEEFGIGFPPRIFGLRFGETLYSVNLLPLGGFVKIFGEEGEHARDPRSFASRPLGTRALVIVAGVVMNILLAFVLYAAGHTLGLPTIIESDTIASRAENVQIQITSVAGDSPAADSGMRLGDAITNIYVGDEVFAIMAIDDVQQIILDNTGSEIRVEVLRGTEPISFILTPRENPPAGEGAIGVAMVRVGTISYPWYEAIWRGAETTYRTLGAIFSAFGGIIVDLVKTGTLTADVSGPVGIAVFASQISELGFIYILQLAALLSLNLAIINIIPFPALDGGRLLFLAIEFIKGSPVNKRVEQFAHTAGFALLILLMIAITIRDVGRFL